MQLWAIAPQLVMGKSQEMRHSLSIRATLKVTRQCKGITLIVEGSLPRPRRMAQGSRKYMAA